MTFGRSGERQLGTVVAFAIPTMPNEPSFSSVPDRRTARRAATRHRRAMAGVFVALRFTIQMGNTTHTLEVEAVVRSVRQNTPPQTPIGRSRSE